MDGYDRWKARQIEEWLYVLLHPPGQCEETCPVCCPQGDWGGYDPGPGYDPSGCHGSIEDWYEALLDEETFEGGLVGHLRSAAEDVLDGNRRRNKGGA